MNLVRILFAVFFCIGVFVCDSVANWVMITNTYPPYSEESWTYLYDGDGLAYSGRITSSQGSAEVWATVELVGPSNSQMAHLESKNLLGTFLRRYQWQGQGSPPAFTRWQLAGEMSRFCLVVTENRQTWFDEAKAEASSQFRCIVPGDSSTTTHNSLAHALNGNRGIGVQVSVPFISIGFQWLLGEIAHTLGIGGSVLADGDSDSSQTLVALRGIIDSMVCNSFVNGDNEYADSYLYLTIWQP